MAVKTDTIGHPSRSDVSINIDPTTGKVNFPNGGVTNGLFYKADPASVAFTKTAVGSANIKAGTVVDVNGTVVTFASATAITMPTFTTGADYYIYVSNAGVIQAVAATGAWPTPVASPPANSVLIGGFHYAPGGNAAAQAGGNTTAQINEYSFWDLKFKPATADPRGMTLVASKFWSDIYFLNTNPDTYGTSRYNQSITGGATAGGQPTAIIPALFGGNGSTTYTLMDWWSTSECLSAYGKRLPTYAEFAALAYGTTEATARGTDMYTTTLDARFTSKWGVIQSTGVKYSWGHDFGGGAGSAAMTANTGGRGSTYQLPNVGKFGGAYYDATDAGSRMSIWSTAPNSSSTSTTGRGVCDHLQLV